MTLKVQKKAKIKNKYQNSLSFTLPTLLMKYKLGDLFLGIAYFQGVKKNDCVLKKIGTHFLLFFYDLKGPEKGKNKK